MVDDLGPLAWVMDELRRSLEVAGTALRRQVREEAMASRSASSASDSSSLPMARLQLHQAAGALEMVGLAAPARVVRAMETATQRFIDDPTRCNESSVVSVERAGFAVAEMLDGLLQAKPWSPVALFPQYRAVMALVGADRIHPADLWPLDGAWRLGDPPDVSFAQADPESTDSLRLRLDQSLLRVVKSADTAAARELAVLCEGLAATETAPGGAAARSLWCLAAGFFEALSLSLLPFDLYVKRTASRVLVQYAQLAKGDRVVSERLAQDLAFFCAQAVPIDPLSARRLVAVRRAWNLERHAPVDYEVEQFGRFDPLVLAQVRKRLVAVRESWSALAGGDASRLRSTGEQFQQLRDALVRLHLPFSSLLEGLSDMARDVSERAKLPRPELAMEVATCILFLEAACQDFDPADPQLMVRVQRLADRLQRVMQGEAPQPLETWVEELYRRVSHRQTMGSIVDELRVSLAELEKELDAFFRAPDQFARLQPLPGRLNQMRGVLSVLGLDHAAQALTHMRDWVQALVQSPGDVVTADFGVIGNNLGALGFMIDMLDYQPALARKLFKFDAIKGELAPVMGRVAGVERWTPVPPISEIADPVELLESVDAIDSIELAISPDADGVVDTAVLAGLAPEPAPAPEPQAPSAVEDLFELAPAPAPEPEPEPEPELPIDTPPEDRLKVVGSLRIDQALFNVYLNEADEWSRRLQADVSEWALDPQQAPAPSLVTLAHALAGSSSMIGFGSLADLARRMESSLQRTLAQGGGTHDHARVCGDVAEEIRRLLHQFAAGFLPDCAPQVAQALANLEAIELPARAAASAFASGLDSELFGFFEEEALELLPVLAGALRQWHAHPDNLGARDEILRVLHTLKGSARLAGALQLGSQAHALESLIEALPSDVSCDAIEPAMQALDGLQTAFDTLRKAIRSEAPGAQPHEPAPAPEPVPEPAPAPAPVPAWNSAADTPNAKGAPSETLLETDAAFDVPAQMQSDLAPPLVTGPAPQRAGQAMVRVRAQLLDRLMNQTGEVMITRAQIEVEVGQMRGALHELTGNLERLRTQLRDIELQSELQMQSHRTKDGAADFDPLEFDRFTRVQELTRMMAESVGDVATVQRTLERTVTATEDGLLAQSRQTRALQRDLLRTRMLEFESLADRLRRVVRLAAQECGKQVKLTLEGAAIEMDRGVLDRMTGAFEHLLRNAVAHGIEDSATRMAAGKPAVGQIMIRLAQAGNDVSIRFEDDGSGLDLARIRDKALALGLLAPGASASLADCAHLIFAPGLSTAASVSELAGRGVGMDAVRAEVQAVGGRIETHSQPGQGTCFELVLPLTTAVTQVVLLQSDHLVFGVPVPLVEVVLSADAAALQQARLSGHWTHDGHSLPFFWSGALLQSSSHSSQSQTRTAPVVILRSAAQRVALQVDAVQGQQEVVVKHLGPQLAHLPGLAGVTVLPSGAVVLIYNPVALAAVHGAQRRDPAEDFGGREAALGSGGGAGLAPLVLVVDDSITVRRVTQRLLQREGYRVALAGDGLQALEQLALETPAVVLSDIEMPRMDGFDLVRNLRADERWAGLPVVMITSRIAQKHREHADSLGVNHYLGKPYPEDELLALVGRYALTPRSS